ncbi:MAG: N-acetylmuramoyl-L-alanine amidase [Ruminococcus sp.]|nr:N-acetylmuramoyl-L-alanine amidase [Ruminococcus sp.]
MKIGLRGGHSPNCKGAMGIIDEQAEVRKIYNEMVPMLQAAGHTVIDCNSNANSVVGELNDGTNKANANNCEMFVSIHMNAAGSPDANGSEVFLYNNGNAVMNQRATSICDKFAQKGFPNRGVKFNTAYHDLNASSMPAMIVETLFCTGIADVDRYRALGPKGIATLIVEGITGKVVSSAPVQLQQTPDSKKGSTATMVCFYRVTDLDKDKVYYFDGFTAHPLNHPDEKKVLNDIYKANNGKDMPEFLWTSKAPWFTRLQNAVERKPQFVIKK